MLPCGQRRSSPSSRTRRAARCCSRARRRASTCSTSTTGAVRRSSWWSPRRRRAPREASAARPGWARTVLPRTRFTSAGRPRDVIGVQDVRVLVGDELEVPVVHVAERRDVVRRRDVEGDRVVRERRSGAVRRVRLVGEDDLGPLRRGPADGGLEARVDVLAEIGDVLGDRLFARVVRNAEVFRLDRVPCQRREAGGARGGGVEHRVHRQEERADADEESPVHRGTEGLRSIHARCRPRGTVCTSGSVSREARRRPGSRRGRRALLRNRG